MEEYINKAVMLSELERLSNLGVGQTAIPVMLQIISRLPTVKVPLEADYCHLIGCINAPPGGSYCERGVCCERLVWETMCPKLEARFKKGVISST